jgi:hypothetical protein
MKAVIRAIVLAALAGLFLRGVSYGADLKAPVLKAPPGYPVGCGLFYGLDTQGAAGTVQGNVPVGTTTLNADVGVVVGYTCPMGVGSGWFVEGDFNWTNVNGNSTGFSFNGPAHFEQRFAFFGGLDQILSAFPTISGSLALPSVPACPTTVTCGPSMLYLFGSTHEQDISVNFNGLAANREWAFSPGIGLGYLSRWSNGVMSDVFAEWQMKANQICVGPFHCATTGNMARVGFSLKY